MIYPTEQQVLDDIGAWFIKLGTDRVFTCVFTRDNELYRASLTEADTVDKTLTRIGMQPACEMALHNAQRYDTA